MRTTLSLDDDVYAAAESLARGSGQGLGKVISTLARRGLEPRSASKRSSQLPTFTIPANAKMIPGNRASELLDDDE